MKAKAPHAARILLGIVFVVFGLNGFLHFLPQPAMSGPPASFAKALAETGYMFPLIKGTEAIAGALLLSGRFVPLALTLLAPVIVNIVGFHAFLAPAGIGLPVVVVALEIYLARSYRSAFAPMLRARVEPDARGEVTAIHEAGAPAR
jgi:uncharacterized membrane protein YphA (DoxX/SURF4 family)